MNDVTLSFAWMGFNIDRLRHVARHMTVQDEKLIEEQQNELRKSFPNKFMPNCFALGIAIMRYD